MSQSPEALAAARYMIQHNWLRDGVAEEQVAVIIATLSQVQTRQAMETISAMNEHIERLLKVGNDLVDLGERTLKSL